MTIAPAIAIPRGHRVPLLLLLAFLLIGAALGIAPRYRQDWLLENLLVLVAVPLLVATYRGLRFSNAAYLSMFVFFVLHEIGAHYTYSLVPFTAPDVVGLARNHYDRVIHFGFGLLLYVPIVELLDARAPPRGLWRHLLPVLFVLASSAIYELLEWAAAGVFGGDLGAAYLGMQGDEWDSQRDMACAALGALLGAVLLALFRRRRPT